MKNTIYPYPFKLSATGDLSDGLVFHVPSFCRSNHKTNKCRDFYKNECENEGYKQCPYGFAVNVNHFLGQKLPDSSTRKNSLKLKATSSSTNS